MSKKKEKIVSPEEADYLEWRDQFLSDPEKRIIYEEEAAKSELWLQLVEARQAAGLTQQELAERLDVSQAQISRLEKQGYDSYTLSSLKRYVWALGEGYTLEVAIRVPQGDQNPS